MGPTTFFAAPERESASTVETQRTIVSSRLERTLDDLPDMTAVLNRHRQIVYANKALRDLGETDHLQGLRPGEALRCVNVEDAPNGCGTSKRCRFCGAVGAIVEAQEKLEPTQRECSIAADFGGRPTSFDLRVSVVPFEIGGEPYQIVTFTDTASERHREALERVFFHDVLNTASGIHATVTLLNDCPDEVEKNELMSALTSMADGLIDEIKGQRLLVSAENGTLAAQRSEIRVARFLESVRRRFFAVQIETAPQVSIAMEEDFALLTDVTILSRVMTNLVKNAVEAGGRNAEVVVSCVRDEGDAVFSVWNPVAMSSEVQLQLFNHRFSTKGRDRGLGTYSVKLFVERYLGGKVWFRSTEEDGTTFYVRLPLCE